MNGLSTTGIICQKYTFCELPVRLPGITLGRVVITRSCRLLMTFQLKTVGNILMKISFTIQVETIRLLTFCLIFCV